VRLNIFVLDLDHRTNVSYYIDKHIVKQTLEAAQLLCSARNVVGDGKGQYKTAHKNHPCTIWARTSSANYRWLCELGIEIGNEYTFRYGKRHKSLDVILDCYCNIPSVDGLFTLPPSCMKPEFIIGDNVVENYRNYYIKGKQIDKNGKSMLKWTKRERPWWYTCTN